MVILNQQQFAAVDVAAGLTSWQAMAWGFHYDDVPPDVVERDMNRGDPSLGDAVPSWASATMPLAVAMSCLTPYAIAPEAASVTCPVLLAMGERDVVVDPPGELRAYQSATSIDYYVCPRMGHMHNFAGTRELMWRRIDAWGDWVRRAVEPG
jgi:pimeloyl-ACP methyl ester carboxylesterase